MVNDNIPFKRQPECFRYSIKCFINYTWRFPFDWKNPCGYLIAVAIQLHLESIQLQYIEAFLTLGGAGLLFAFTIVKDIKNNLNEFNEVAKKRKSQLPEIMVQLANVICYHRDLKELSSLNWDIQISIDNKRYDKSWILCRLPGYIVQVYTVPLMALFMGCTVTTCLSLLMIQVELVQVCIFLHFDNHAISHLSSLFCQCLVTRYFSDTIASDLFWSFFNFTCWIHKWNWAKAWIYIHRNRGCNLSTRVVFVPD